MGLEELEHTIPVIIHYNYQNGFKWHDKYEAKMPDVFIADYHNHNMKCFDNKFGVWNDTKAKRMKIFEL